MSKERPNVAKVIKKFQKKKWVIDCPPKLHESLLEILECEGVSWSDGAPIIPCADCWDTQDSVDHYFEIVKKKKLNFHDKDCYPSYHYKIFTFKEFLDLLVEALNKDFPDIEISIAA